MYIWPFHYESEKYLHSSVDITIIRQHDWYEVIMYILVDQFWSDMKKILVYVKLGFSLISSKF